MRFHTYHREAATWREAPPLQQRLRRILLAILGVVAAVGIAVPATASADTSIQPADPGCSLQGGGTPCTFSATGASGTTSVEQAAIGWATPYANENAGASDGSWDGLCLTFVADAYSNAGFDWRSEITVPVNGDTYPEDIWGHFSGGTTGSGVAPPGAWVFFEPTNGDRIYSHVTLSTGGGNMISTDDSLGAGVHYETLAQHDYAVELGWWLPDQ